MGNEMGNDLTGVVIDNREGGIKKCAFFVDLDYVVPAVWARHRRGPQTALRHRPVFSTASGDQIAATG